MENNHKTVLTVNDLFAKHDVEGLLEHFTEDIRWEMVGDMTSEGKDGFRQVMGNQPVESARTEIYGHVAEGNRVWIEGLTECRLKDGNVFNARFVDIYSFRDGKVNEIKSYIVEQK